MRKLIFTASVLVVLFIILEVSLRKLYGFGNMNILFQEDAAFEYIAKPNQDKVRFGNKVIYNEFSMRSLPLTENDNCVVLGFGDSVLNGGTVIDQDSLATTITERQLQNEMGAGIRFLNISAPSWGPDNCAAYLKKYGAFNAKMIILLVSSHDAYDNMTFEKTVGVHESYPEQPYSLAVLEVMDRYIKPRIMGWFDTKETNDLMINEKGGQFSAGFDVFKNFAEKNNIPLIVCLHAERGEVEEGKFNPQGQEILDYCAKNNIPVISGLQIGEAPGDFLDYIHLNTRGQARWAKGWYQKISEGIGACRQL
ncbi:MAG TPA: hypothetical protein VFZ52_07190 [Chryseolinea sp.]